MPRGKKKTRTKIIEYAGGATVVSLIAIIMIAWVYPVLVATPNPLESLIPREAPEEAIKDNPQVALRVYCKKLLARTSSDQNLDIYDVNMEWVETVTTSSGVATCSYMYYVGETLNIQPRQAAPGTADPYVGPIQTFTVPTGTAGDTVNLGTVMVRDVTGTAATLGVSDIAGNTVDDATVDYFNTTDTVIKIDLHSIDSNTYYGMESFTDYTTMREYLGGLYFVWKGTSGQSFIADYTFSDASYVYYVFKIADYLVDDANINTDDIISASLSTAGGASLVADATVYLDVYDGLWLINGGVSSTASFVDTKSVTAITTKVA